MSTTGESCIRLLEQYGVDTVFGIPGVHTLEFYRGLSGSSIRHISASHEQGAAFMADGYGRTSGVPGVCLVVTGPGLTNAATAIANAFHDSRPLLVLSSAGADGERGGQGALHDLPDQRQFMATITAESVLVEDPAELARAFQLAWDVFECGRPRPVHIAVPINVLEAAAGEATRLGPSSRRQRRPDGAVITAAELLIAAERPMILLGGGATDAGPAALDLAELLGAPVVTTVNGKGIVPADHPLSLGARLTLGAVVSELEESDAVVAVGTEFSETDYFFAPHRPRLGESLIRIDIDPAEFACARPRAAVELTGDANEVLSSLVARLRAAAAGVNAPPALSAARANGGHARAADIRARCAWWSDAAPMIPVLDEISAALPRDAIVTADSTQLAYVANHYLDICAPRSYLAPAGFGTLGPALPMAIGAQLAAPGRPVLCIVGDGGFLFTVAELVTAVRYRLPIAVLLWQNRGYQEIRDAFDAAQIRRVGTDTSAHDYLELAAGFGANSVRACAGQLGDALRLAWSADKPTVIEFEAPGA